MLFRSLLAAQSIICRGMCSFGNLVRHSGIQPESAIIAALHIELMAKIWCLLQESNQRHLTYKTSALPSELNRLIGGPQPDSNQQPADYESVALPFSYGAFVVGLTRSRKSANHRAEFLLAAPQLLIALSGIEPLHSSDFASR